MYFKIIFNKHYIMLSLPHLFIILHHILIVKFLCTGTVMHLVSIMQNTEDYDRNILSSEFILDPIYAQNRPTLNTGQEYSEYRGLRTVPPIPI